MAKLIQFSNVLIILLNWKKKLKIPLTFKSFTKLKIKKYIYIYILDVMKINVFLIFVFLIKKY